MSFDDRSEWLEADGLGGFASGTVSGIRTRRYHALLLTATTPPTGRLVLVNGCEAWVETPSGSAALTTQRYAPDVLHPDGAHRIVSFSGEPWPTWEFDVLDARIRQEVFVQHGTGTTAIAWTLISGSGPLALKARPLLSGRDYHAMQHENASFRFSAAVDEAAVSFSPYDGVPGVVMLTNGQYHHAPDWYRNFLYSLEQERGLDATEDLASPGIFTWRLASAGDRAVWLLSTSDRRTPAAQSRAAVASLYAEVEASERARRVTCTAPTDRAVDAYIVARGAGRTIIAGYPWFTDWGRDTFIAIRGLCLATGRFDDARDVLVEWAGAVSEGMLPNRFPDRGEAPEFNAVDASLWFIIAAAELIQLTSGGSVLSEAHTRALETAILQIVSGYAAGTRFGIRMGEDGLLAAGVPGVQLTWMDARVGDRVITPRIGKPVEVQALWLNALRIAGALDSGWLVAFDRGRAAFVERFWNDRGYLSDVVDVDHVRGTRDDSLRPNQILAVGGLPASLLDRARARRVVDIVERHLLTPLGLRSLAPGEPGYSGQYAGGPASRDAVYHQGTVWPWLIGPFVEAWIRVRGNTASARREARSRFLDSLRAHLQGDGIGHISEIADGEAPFTPRGCPFQAWSLAEFVRADRTVLASGRAAARRRIAEPQLA